MAPRIPLSAVNKTPALFFSPAKASSRLLPPLVRTSQQARTAAACATDPVLEAMMGRAGYDTTNMKVAKNPRPAAAAKKNDDPKTGAQKTQDDSNNKNNKGDAEKKPREQTPSCKSKLSLSLSRQVEKRCPLPGMEK